MCRVHELEADKMALQSERLVRQHELRRRDLVILRYDKQRQLAEDIITKQRQVMEGEFRDQEINFFLWNKFFCSRVQNQITSGSSGSLSVVPTGDPRLHLQ